MHPARWLALLGLACWLASLLLPAVQGSGLPTQSGLDMLRQGAGAWRDGVVAWYANPLLLAALVSSWLGRYRLALGVSSLALGLALSSFAAAELAGRSVPQFSFAIGFYAWLAACVVATLAASLGIYKVSRALKP